MPASLSVYFHLFIWCFLLSLVFATFSFPLLYKLCFLSSVVLYLAFLISTSPIFWPDLTYFTSPLSFLLTPTLLLVVTPFIFYVYFFSCPILSKQLSIWYSSPVVAPFFFCLFYHSFSPLCLLHSSLELSPLPFFLSLVYSIFLFCPLLFSPYSAYPLLGCFLLSYSYL